MIPLQVLHDFGSRFFIFLRSFVMFVLFSFVQQLLVLMKPKASETSRRLKLRMPNTSCVFQDMGILTLECVQRNFDLIGFLDFSVMIRNTCVVSKGAEFPSLISNFCCFGKLWLIGLILNFKLIYCVFNDQPDSTGFINFHFSGLTTVYSKHFNKYFITYDF